MSPMPSPSVSAWSAIAVVGQLSMELFIPSPSASGSTNVKVLLESCVCMRFPFKSKIGGRRYAYGVKKTLLSGGLNYH